MRLKKVLDDQSLTSSKLGQLTKKDSDSFMLKDLGDLMYEKKINKSWFVNTHGSDIMSSVLVVVQKKKIEEFKVSYENLLLDHYKND